MTGERGTNGRNGWRPITEAPRDGTHFQVGCFDGGTGFGWPNGTHQPTQTVAHWFNDGIYVSVYGGEEATPKKWTHWQPLPSPPTAEDARASTGDRDAEGK
jgi:hypothetical protein